MASPSLTLYPGVLQMWSLTLRECESIIMMSVECRGPPDEEDDEEDEWGC